MDNQSFVVDEKLTVVGHTQGHKKDCVVVYKSGKCGYRSCGCISANPEVPVTIYGLDDVELKNISLQFHSTMGMKAGVSGGCVETRVRTDRGDLLVAVCGDRNKPAILTYHDIGLNYTSFEAFFNFVDMRAVLQNFCVYHVTAPGQEDHAQRLPDAYVYPTVGELANELKYVLAFFGLRSVIGFGVGAGAHILAKFALTYPDKVDALALVNCSSTRSGWTEWYCQKRNIHALRNRGMCKEPIDYLMWHHFGRSPEEVSPDIVATYSEHFTKRVNPHNLAHLLEAYISRQDLAISRGGDTLAVPVLNLTGSASPHVTDTVTFNGRLNPRNSTWMKISDCASVLDEQPERVAEAFRLFLQGEGYVAPLSPSKMLEWRREAAGAHSRRACRLSPVMRITENPISEAVVC